MLPGRERHDAGAADLAAVRGGPWKSLLDWSRRPRETRTRMGCLVRKRRSSSRLGLRRVMECRGPHVRGRHTAPRRCGARETAGEAVFYRAGAKEVGLLSPAGSGARPGQRLVKTFASRKNTIQDPVCQVLDLCAALLLVADNNPPLRAPDNNPARASEGPVGRASDLDKAVERPHSPLDNPGFRAIIGLVRSGIRPVAADKPPAAPG